MRVLCLHGVGSSAAICETQLRPFLQAVDSSYEFVFVDGPVLSPRGPGENDTYFSATLWAGPGHTDEVIAIGVSAAIDGPFFSHTAGYSTADMVDAFNHLEDTIDELGPFDGVLGFSQGAALTIAYMHRQQELNKMVPFGFALCLSSVLPCSADDMYLQGVIEKLSEHRRPLTIGPAALDASLSSEERIFLNFMMRTIVPAKKMRAMLPDIDLNHYTDGHGVDAPRLMHPQLLKERIHIPTVHVIGKRDFDFMRNMSEAALGLCSESMVKKLQHSGGHHPPQKHAEVQALIRAMEWAARQSQRVLHLHL
jgi:predicted esterase